MGRLERRVLVPQGLRPVILEEAIELKGKNLLCLAIITSLVATMMLFVYAQPQYPPTTYYFDPSSITAPPPDIGDWFMVTIRVNEVPDLFMWVMDISWDPAVFELNGEPIEGNAIKASGATMFTYSSIVDGFIDDLMCGSMFGAEVSVPPNPTDLVHLNFTVESFPSSSAYIEMPWANWVNIGGDEGAPDLIPFEFIFVPPPPTAPKARFTPETCEMVYVGETVTLDASASTDGWDTLPDPGNACPIVSYTWDIDIGNDGTIDFTLDGVTAEFLCEASGDVAITLTVYAPDPTLPTHPDYVDTDSETHVIHQITRPVGCVLDVYTERGGIGPGINPDTLEQWPYPTGWSDAYAPNEEVIVYAKVTYNDDPVANKPVAFAMIDETGEAVDYRTAFTNAEGIATTSFRLIWECDKTFEGKFEVWEIWASVSVNDVEQLDVAKFRYGWLVQIDEIIAPSAAQKCVPFPVIIDLNNIAYTDKVVCVTVVIYDDCGVPVDVDVLPGWTVFANDGLTPEFTMHIPKWAYLGTGTIYVNVFTGMPQECGVPMCPEVSAIIILEKAP